MRIFPSTFCKAFRTWPPLVAPAPAAEAPKPIEKAAREIVKAIKDTKKKVQASIQGDTVRVSGKDRDTLQDIMGMLRQRDFGIDMQFTNYRNQ